MTSEKGQLRSAQLSNLRNRPAQLREIFTQVSSAQVGKNNQNLQLWLDFILEFYTLNSWIQRKILSLIQLSYNFSQIKRFFLNFSYYTTLWEPFILSSE